MNYIVPSGPTKEDDLSRLETVLQDARANRSNGNSSKIVISGIGPDLNERLHRINEKGLQQPIGNTLGLDVHPELWNESYKNIERIFGVDTQAVNSEGNLLYSFQGNLEGEWTIVSRPIHLKKFKLIEKKLRARGELSDDLTLKYQSSGYVGNIFKKTKDIIYDSVSLVREMYKSLRN